MLDVSPLSNFASYIPPIPIEPLFPNFAFCHHAYGAGLKKDDCMHTGGILPRGSTPVSYIVNQEKAGGASRYQLPFEASFAGVTISVQVAGPVDIKSMILIPDEIRGMAAYLANSCVGRFGTGGFITRKLQGLMDYVTSPKSDLDAPRYPDSTAFVTVTVSSPDIRTTAGNYDPAMALFLQQAETRTLNNVSPPSQLEIANRVVRFNIQGQRMRRLGRVAWWDQSSLQENTTEIATRFLAEHSSNLTAAKMKTFQRKGRSRRLSMD